MSARGNFDISATGRAGYANHGDFSAVVAAPAKDVFAYVDDQMHLSSHVSQSSWKMGGGKMKTEVDELGGKSIGSKIRLTGRILGVLLWVEEVVIDRAPPYRKAWETIGKPRLLVIGQYRMGFEITPLPSESRLRVFIDYDLPETVPARWFGNLFGDYYAKWCIRQMVEDTVNHFATT